MTSIVEAKAGMRALAQKSQEVLNDSSLTNAEKRNRLTEMQKDLKSFEETIKLHEDAKSFMFGGEAPEEQKAEPVAGVKSLSRMIVESDAFKSAAASKGARFSLTTPELKAAVTVDEGTTIANGQLNGAAGVLALPQYQPGIVDLRFAPLSVAQLFAQGTTTSPIISYVKEASETQGAGATAEKGKAGQADATFARVNEQVGKVSGLFKITEEMLQDVAQAESFIQGRLVAQVGREEENEVLNGTGYPSLAGLLGRSGLASAIAVGTAGTTDPITVIDAIFNQITAIRTTAFVEPDAIVMNPADWQKIRLAKDKNNQYLAGGPFTGAYGNGGFSNVAALWGFPVVQSPRIAAGKALVGGFQEGGQFFRRSGVTVEMTNSNNDDFENGLVTVRADSRSALAIYRPGAFGAVNITW